MTKLIYKTEKPLFFLALLVSIIFWAAVAWFTKGIGLAVIPLLGVVYLFAQSAFVSYFRGAGTLVGAEQFPDLFQKVEACAAIVGLKKIPRVYVIQGNGILNAFATTFLRKNYVVLYADIVDALENDPEAVKFYIGHEMGHLHRHHLAWEAALSPGLTLPLLGAAYSRAREYTCDQYGLACSSEESAKKGLAVLSVGGKLYRKLDFAAYLKQLSTTSEFWMSFHELIGSYPWLVKRVAAVSKTTLIQKVPRRNVFAYLPAVLIPRLSITTLLLIYFVFVMVGIERGHNLVKQTQQYDEGLVNDYNPVKFDTTGMSTAEILDKVAVDMNKTLPEELAEGLVHESVQRQGEDMLVYNYKLSPELAQKLPEMSHYFQEDMKNYWCATPELETLRSLKVKVVDQYRDGAGKELTKVTFDTAECEGYNPAALSGDHEDSPVEGVPSEPAAQPAQ